jgi:AcrR family transcriptional regulator
VDGEDEHEPSRTRCAPVPVHSVAVDAAHHEVDGRTLRHLQRRPELLAGAVEYILENGVAELTLRPLAKALGVTHATLLRHFGTKEELVTEVITAIRVDLLDNLRASVGDIAAAPPARSMRTVWRQLCEPTERRQFVLLFELVAIQAREPDRFGSLATVLIADFLQPLEASLRSHGLSRSEARDLATGFLAQLRGLQLDLAVSGDQRRVNAAMNRYIDLITQNDG